MQQRKKTVSLVVILAVLFVLFMGARAKQDNDLTPSDLRPEGATYSERGSYPVGIRDLIIQGERPLEISFWYPAATGEGEVVQYAYEVKMANPLGTVTLSTFAGLALRDAAFDVSAVPYPLVVLSPGFSLGSSTYAWLAEHLASYGFVVIAPEHAEHLDPENELWKSAITRPTEILTVLNYVDTQGASEETLAAQLDTNRIAVIGHSYGGYTSLAAAGARFDTASFRSHCEKAQTENHPAAWLCDQLLPHMMDMTALAGLASLPENLWPAWADPRVKAIVPMAGDAFFFGQAGLAEITVPVMAIGGTLDTDSPYLWGTHPTYEYVSSPKKVRIALTDAEHMIFTGPCEKITWFLKFFSDEFCSDTEWDRYHAHSLIKHFTTAFLLAELRQDPDAAAALVPEAVHFPEVMYEAQGY